MLNRLKKSDCWIMILGDATFLFLSYFLAYYLRFDGDVPPNYLIQIKQTVVWIVFLKMVCLFLFGLYKEMWEYNYIHESFILTQSCLISSCIIFAYYFEIVGFPGFSKGVLVIDFFLALISLGGYRLVVRLFYYRKNGRCGLLTLRNGIDNGQRPSLAGAGNVGEKVLRKIKENQAMQYVFVWLFNFGIVAFLFANVVYRFFTLNDHGSFIEGLFIFLGMCSLFVILFPKYLRMLGFLFGLSFFLFGFRAFDVQSQIFETIVAFMAITVVAVNLIRGGSTRHNRHLVVFLICYVGLSLFSLLLLPAGLILEDFWFFGLKASLLQIANSVPNGYLYPIAGINRLILFGILALSFSRAKNSYEMFKWLFIGIFTGCVFSAFVGLLDFYKIISLSWYRLGTVITPGSLHSTFLNRGWFAEFVLTVIPFSMIGFMSRIKGLWWRIFLLSTLVICEISLILAGARAGWLSYPVILFFCWLFVYFSKEGRLVNLRFSWWRFAKVAVSVPITIAVSFFLIFQVLMPLSDYFRKEPGVQKTLSVRAKSDDVDKNRPLSKETNLKNMEGTSEQAFRYIKERASSLADAGNRVPVWMQGVDVGRERPVFGMGYESFCWQANILSGFPFSYYTINKKNKAKRILDTPHNIFLQLFVSGGVVGFGLWILMMVYVLTILILDLKKNRQFLNIPVIISIISFHMYGIFQSMQYIPMIWLLIFLNLGYAMTISEDVLPARVKKIAGILPKAVLICTLLGVFVYFLGYGSVSLAKKYGMEIYGMDKDRDNYIGFYPEERRHWRPYRWSGKTSLIKTPGNGIIALGFECHTPGIEKEPVVLSVYVDGEFMDMITFAKKRGFRRFYFLEKRNEDNHKILLRVSRTWNPKKMGTGDDWRDLGVTLNEIKFLGEMPKDGIGFYDWETLGGEIPGWPDDNKVKRFRWSKGRASLVISDFGFRNAERGKGENEKDGRKIYLLCSHPDIEKEPVVVSILGNGRVLAEERFEKNEWRKVALVGGEFGAAKVLTFQVSRTWNPQVMGVAEDGRDLGVAVAILREENEVHGELNSDR
jgi:hypothetical protein